MIAWVNGALAYSRLTNEVLGVAGIEKNTFVNSRVANFGHGWCLVYQTFVFIYQPNASKTRLQKKNAQILTEILI